MIFVLLPTAHLIYSMCGHYAWKKKDLAWYIHTECLNTSMCDSRTETWNSNPANHRKSEIESLFACLHIDLFLLLHLHLFLLLHLFLHLHLHFLNDCRCRKGAGSSFSIHPDFITNTAATALSPSIFPHLPSIPTLSTPSLCEPAAWQ